MKSIALRSKKLFGKIKLVTNKAMEKGFVHLLSANFLLQIAGFGGQIFLTRILSVEDIGRLKVLQSFLSNLTIIAGLGLNVAILKMCSEKISIQQKQRLFEDGFKVTAIFSVLITLLTFIIAGFGGFSSDIQINNLMKIYAFQIPFLSISAYFVAYLQSQKKIHLMSNVQSISKIAVVIISILGAYIYGMTGYIITLVIALSLTTLLFVPFIKSELQSIKYKRIDKGLIAKPLKLGSYSFITNLLGQLILTFNVLILNYMNVDPKEVGYYGIAQLIITSMMIIPNTLNQLMIPYISEQTDNRVQIKKMLKKFESRMLMITALLCTSTFFIIPLIMPMIFGKEYVNSVPYFQVLVIGLFFWSIYSPKGITLLSIGRVDLNFKVSCISFGFNIILNFILIYKFGALGAAIATTATYFITIFINRIYFKKV
ncbi:flippase [Bacillus thuringiensis]|nr:flippase [Bacillus thuringiensis]